MAKFNEDAWKTPEDIAEEERRLEEQAEQNQSQLEKEVEELRAIVDTLFGKVES